MSTIKGLLYLNHAPSAIASVLKQTQVLFNVATLVSTSPYRRATKVAPLPSSHHNKHRLNSLSLSQCLRLCVIFKPSITLCRRKSLSSSLIARETLLIVANKVREHVMSATEPSLGLQLFSYYRYRQKSWSDITFVVTERTKPLTHCCGCLHLTSISSTSGFYRLPP